MPLRGLAHGRRDKMVLLGEQVPRAALALEGLRQVYAAMTHYMDGVVGNLTKHMQSLDLWDNTLMIGVSDNVRTAVERHT